MQLTDQPASHADRAHPGVSSSGGPEGNERLTAVTGVILLLLFAAEGLTILSLSSLLYWHYLLGFMLVGPICAKLGSTIYRFARYYARAPEYRRKGPPEPLLRVLGPFVVLTTLAMMITGILLAIDGTSPAIGFAGVSLLMLHKLSFLAWAAVMTVHVLAYIWRLPRLVAADLTPDSRARRAAVQVGGRWLRWSTTVLSLGGGVALALACVHLYANWHR